MALNSLSWRWPGVLLLLPSLVHGAHPLITEDTGTQGRGGFQVELTAEQGTDRDDGVTTRSTNLAVVLSYGATDNLDVIVALPHQRITTEQGGTRDTVSGIGDIGLDIKWRFHEKDQLSFALKAGTTLSTGDETRALGAGKSTRSLYLVTSIVPEPWEFHLHLGYIDYPNKLGERDERWHASFAAGYRFDDRLRLVADIGTNTNPDPAVDERPAFLIVGLIYAVDDKLDLDLGYKKGLTGPETDRTLLAGATLRF